MRKPNVVPTYLKNRGFARIRVCGKEYGLGRYGSTESKIKYKEICAKIIAGMPFEHILAAGRKTPESKIVGYLNEEISELKKKITELESAIESMILCSYVEIVEAERKPVVQNKKKRPDGEGTVS